ncbi:MAG TPA: BrnA antitoxin family protein [Vicinamibacterales bacterium]|nr:BrnA antitoxin family protein [Vicinamibacterales bacterium]
MSAKPTKQPLNKPSRGRADLERLRKMKEAEIDRASPPELELPDDFWDDAEVVAPEKEAISLRVDQDVLAWFRERGPRYQTRMNAVLRSYVRSMKRRRGRSRSSRGEGDSPGGAS